MATCRFEGNADMYGLGIRLGFYFQWFGTIFAGWLAPTEVRALRFSLNLFVAATFLALIILTANHVESLEPAETYIVLLLMFGAYLAWVPIYFWRLLTCCDPYWDPTRWPLVNPGALSANLNFVITIGSLVYQYWFWFARVPALDNYNCQQYGFIFGQVRLNSVASVVVNALIYFWLGLVCLYIILLQLRHVVGLPEPERRARVISRRHKEAHINLLRNIESWIRLIVAVVIILATELTISWNEIDGVNSVASVGQTIPLVIGLGTIVRILFVYWFQWEDDESDISTDDGYSPPRPHRRPPSGGPIPVRQPPLGKRASVRRSYNYEPRPPPMAHRVPAQHHTRDSVIVDMERG